MGDRDRTSGGTPRRDAAFAASVVDAIDALSRDLHRSPTVVEVAIRLLSSEEEVVAALDAIETVPVENRDDRGPVLRVDPETSLAGAVDFLDPVSRSVIVLRVRDRMTETEIAMRLDLPPSEVSRRVLRSVAQMRRAAA